MPNSVEKSASSVAALPLRGEYRVLTCIMPAGHGAEVLDWIDRHPGDRQRLVQDPVLMQKFIWEAVRLHPASPITKRRALCPVHLPDGHDAETDEYVTVDLTKANRNPELFGGDAEDFNPLREPERRVPLHGLSFGAGPHSCLGKMLAVGVQITDANKDEDETEFGTIFLVLRALLEHGIDRDPDRAIEIDESTTRRHFRTLPFILNPALAVQSSGRVS